MRWVKYTLLILGGILVLGLVLIAIALFTLDNDDYRRLLIRGVAHFTGYRLTVEGPFEVGLSKTPFLSAEDIRIDPEPDGPLPLISRIGKFKIQIALGSLFKGNVVIKELQVEDGVGAVIIKTQAESEDRSNSVRKIPPDIKIPIMESVRLRNIHLDVIDEAADRRVEIHLRQFDIDDIRDTGPLFVNGQGSINGNEFKLDGRLGALSAILKGAQPYPVHLNMSSPGFKLSATGTIEDLPDGEGMKLRLSGEADELSRLFQLLQINVPPLGRLKLEANVIQDFASPGLSDLRLTLTGDTGLALAVNGSVENILSGAGTNIRFSAACANPDIIKRLSPEDLPPVRKIGMSGKVQDKEGALAVEDLSVDAAVEHGLSLTANGRLVLKYIFGVPEITETAIDMVLSIAATEPFKPYMINFLSTSEWFDPDPIKSLPELGPISARARMSGPLERLSLEYIEVETGGSGPLRMTSRGRIGQLSVRGGMTASDIDLTVSVDAKATALLTSGFGAEVPNLGSLALNTRVRGSLNQLQLDDFDARTTHGSGLKMLVSGNVAVEQDDKAGYIGNVALKARLDAPTTHAALAPLGVTDLPQLKTVRFKAQVGGTIRNLSLKQISLNIGRSDAIRIQVGGEVGRIPLTGDRPVSDVKLTASFSAGNTAALTPVLGFSVPDFGPLHAAGRFIDRNGTFGLRDVNVAIGNQKKPAVKLTGSIVSVAKGRELAVEGIDIRAAIRDLGLQPISELLGLPLPDPGSLNGSFRISGSQTKLAISGIRLSTKSPQGMTTAASGDIKRISLAGGAHLTGVALSLSARAPRLGAIPGLGDLKLPELSPFQLKAEINDRKGGLDVEAFDIQGGKGENAYIRIQGKIQDIDDLKKMRLQAGIQTASQSWVQKYLNRPQAENFPLVGAVSITGSDDGIHIHELAFGTADEKLLVLQARGKLSRLSASPEIDLQLTATAPDPSAVESMADVSMPPLGPLSISGRLYGNRQNVAFKGDTRIGETTFASTVSVAFTALRPRIDANFSAQTVNLVNMGIYPEAPPEISAAAAQLRPQKSVRLFDDTPLPLEALNAVDLHLSLNADKLVARHISINDLDLDIRLENGRLRIHPARLVYAAGFTDAELIVDASGSTPEFFLKVTGEDIDIDDLLAHLHRPLILSGALTLVADLHSTGRSVREIVANLDGEFSLALENGRIRRIVYFLSTDAFDLVFTAGDRRRYTDLQCLANKIQFEKGVGTIEIFSMDTPRIRVGGAGHINLANERIDVAINPQKKKRLFRSRSAIQIRGPLANPNIRTIPSKEAAALYGKILMPYVFLPARALDSIVGLLRKDKGGTPCQIK